MNLKRSSLSVTYRFKTAHTQNANEHSIFRRNGSNFLKNIFLKLYKYWIFFFYQTMFFFLKYDTDDNNPVWFRDLVSDFIW